MNDKIFNWIIVFIVLCSTLLKVDLFEDAVTYPKWISALIIISVNTIYFSFILKRYYRIDKLYFSVFIIITYLLLHSLFFFSPFRYIFWYSVLFFWSLYSIFYFLKLKIKVNYIHGSLCLIGVIQSIIVAFQYLSHEKITGTYNNPTGVAIALVCIFPFVHVLYKKVQTTKVKCLYVISMILISAAIFLSECRACIIALIVIVSFIIGSKKYFVVTIGICVTLIFAFNYKKDSSKGRFFIYQTSLSMIDSHSLFWGKGNGAFKKDYMKFQAKRFESNLDSPYAILADNVPHPLNEYILLLIEYGLIGCLFFVTPVWMFFKAVNLRSPAFLCVVAIGIIACFSYPFQYPLTFVLLAYCISSVTCTRVCFLNLGMWIRVFVFFIAFSGMIYLLFDVKRHHVWGKQIALCSLGKATKTLPKYSDLYLEMSDNPYFLYNYGAVLYQLGNYQKSNEILAHCVLYLDDYDIESLIANNCFSLKKYQEAELHYMKASYMCPNRFRSRYQLMLLYKAQNKMLQAQKMAEEIAKKEVKIYSIDIVRMKREASLLLKEMEN